MAAMNVTARPLEVPKRQSRFHMTMRKREAIIGYIFLLPWLVGFLAFLVGPMIASIYLSMTNYKMISAPVWIGLDNYERMLSDPLVNHSLMVTIK